MGQEETHHLQNGSGRRQEEGRHVATETIDKRHNPYKDTPQAMHSGARQSNQERKRTTCKCAEECLEAKGTKALRELHPRRGEQPS